MKPEMVLETIGPKKAQEYLSKNVRNRRINERQVSMYADQILEGKWAVPPNGIGFTKKGDLVDGQHRLAAIIKANKPVKIFVGRYLENDVFDVIDTGRKRSPADALTVAYNISDPNNIAAALRIIYIFETMGEYSHDKVNLPHRALIEMYEKHKGIEKANRSIWTYKLVQTFFSRSVISSCYYMFSRIDSEANLEFWCKLDQGNNLGPKDPVNALRNRMIKYISEHGGAKPPKRMMLALLTKTWNLHLSKTPTDKLVIDEKEPIKITS